MLVWPRVGSALVNLLGEGSGKEAKIGDRSSSLLPLRLAE